MAILQLFLVAFAAYHGLVISQTVCKDGDNNPCKCDLISGEGVIDLSFGKQDSALFSYIADPSSDVSYSYNPCYGFKSDDGTLTGLATMMSATDGSDTDIGQQSSATFLNDSDILSISYDSSDSASTSIVTLKCQSSGPNDLTAQGFDGSQTYGFTLSGPDVCPKKGDGGGGGLSGGSIFLIICTVLIFVYLVGGIIYKKARTDATGTDVIPNKDFWTSLPGLVKDGFMFLVYKCKGKPSPAYESV